MLSPKQSFAGLCPGWVHSGGHSGSWVGYGVSTEEGLLRILRAGLGALRGRNGRWEGRLDWCDDSGSGIGFEEAHATILFGS